MRIWKKHVRVTYDWINLAIRILGLIANPMILLVLSR